ncbi:MAG: hypothetical protein KH024_03150 [Hungatella hathewayi]|nr:hypothetical protein [Hungatella hathewayi]
MQGELTLHNDSSLRASYVGSSSRHTTEHFTRATLEGIAFSNDYYKMKSNAASYFSTLIILALWREVSLSQIGSTCWNTLTVVYLPSGGTSPRSISE